MPYIGENGPRESLAVPTLHSSNLPSELWLPRKVEVEMKWPAVIFRDFHTYSEFKLLTVQTQDRHDAPASPK